MILWSLLGCSSSSFVVGSHSFSIAEIEFHGEMLVSRSWNGQEICIRLISPFLRTKVEATQCAIATIDEIIEGGAWLSVPVDTILGEGELALRWQQNDIFIPLGGRVGEFDFSTLAEAVPLNEKKVSGLDERFLENKGHWNIGEFLLMRGDKINGAVEFQGSQDAKIMLFDHFWLTDGVQTSVEGLEGSEFILQFPIEPNFEDELGILRIHPFFFQAVAPIGDLPSSSEQKYTLKTGIPEYSVLEARQREEILAANHLEEQWVQKEAQNLLLPLIDSETCRSWSKTREIEMIWVGYDISSEWNGEVCSLVIDTEFEQHRRRFSGTIKRD